jgi:3-oxoacyl-[acyl-carrier protein] reductase
MSNINKLAKKKVLVTGGGQGLGFTISEHLIAAGANLAIHYFSSEAGANELKSKAGVGQRVEAFRADLTRPDECAKMVEAAVKSLGGLDVLINNAGDLIGRRMLADVDEEFWRRSLDVNMTSMAFVTRAAVPHLAAAGQSSIVNLSSLAGRKGGHSGSLVYSMAKGAVLTWTRALAVELAPKGIRANALAPGLILGTRFHNTHTTDASAKATIQGIPLGRAGTPEDIARATLFFASEYDGFITGATLDINGGVYCA